MVLKQEFILGTDCTIYIYIYRTGFFFSTILKHEQKPFYKPNSLVSQEVNNTQTSNTLFDTTPPKKLPEVARNFFFKKHKVSWNRVKEKWLRLAWLFYWVGRQSLFFEISWEKLFPKQNKKTHKWKLCHFQKLTFWHA